MPGVPSRPIPRYTRRRNQRVSAQETSPAHSVAIQDHLCRALSVLPGRAAALGHVPGARPTLAQKFDFCPPPPPRIALTDWEAAARRALERGDISASCCICHEPFKLTTQCLLSCSHVFHEACLSLFERVTGTRCCPVCRTTAYGKKCITTGAEAYLTVCATRIQACVRGHLSRLHTFGSLTDRPKQTAIHQRWCLVKMLRGRRCLTESLDMRSNNLDAFLDDVDASLERSRQVFKDPRLPRMECGKCIPMQTVKRRASMYAKDGGYSPSTDCAICLSKLSRSNAPSDLTRLPCSHMFHRACILTLEQHTLRNFKEALRCPCCRSHIHAQRTTKPLA
eukprot:jgi/Botrbrau1/19904/Bobra.0059s0024.1